MNVRRVLVAATVAGALLASSPATAVGTYAMDGKRSTSRSWSGVLSASAVPMTGLTRGAMDPVLEDCTEQSCSIRNLRLTLPKVSSKGEIEIQGVFDATMAAAIVLYDSEGTYLASADLLFCCPSNGETDGDQYALEFEDKRLDPGRYTVAIVNRAGSGAFKATISWKARPPDRKKPS